MLGIEKSFSNFAKYCGLKVEGERTCNPNEELEKHLNKMTSGAVPLSDLLPYEYYDEEEGIVVNRDATCGFWYEINPIVGSNEGIEKNLTMFFNDELPEGMYLQFLIIAGHDISEIMERWEGSRVYGGPELKRITAYRKWFIEKCSKDFAGSSDGRLARNFRTFVTCSSLKKKTAKNTEELIRFKKKLANKLKTEKFAPVLMGANDLIKVGRDILQMNLQNPTGKINYSPINNLSDQICQPSSLIVRPESIIHESNNLESKLFYPKELPAGFSLAEMVSLLGTGDKVIPARFVISYTLAANLGTGGTSRLITQGNRAIHAAERDYTRNDIRAKEQAKEWREVLNTHKQGERFLTESMLVMITAPREDIDIAEEALKSLWNAHDWKLAINTNLQLLSMLAIMPMTAAGYWKSLSFFKLTRYALSGEIVAKLPVQGEWKGVPVSGVLLMGRRGQLFNFNPYFRIGGGGNYNIALIAQSGSGKSFLLEDLATSMNLQNVAVFVMDIGASYENICRLTNSEMVRFNKNNKISLNPFGSLSSSGAVFLKAMEMIKQGYATDEIAKITGLLEEKIKALACGQGNSEKEDKVADAIEILEIKGVDNLGQPKTHFVTKDSIIYAKTLLSAMCDVKGNAREEAILERAISVGVATHGTELDLTKLAQILENLKDRRGEAVEGASRLADSLYPYTEDGIHGRFFKAGAEANFKEMLTVFEFEEIKNDENLLPVILQIILMQITMQFLCGDRSRRFMLIVDEAWMIMDRAASFLEQFARTVRKYGGSLVVCTQDLSSFSNGSAQKAILECSTWKLIMQQDESALTTFVSEERYANNLDLIRSIRKCSNNKFSEVLLDTNGAKIVGRLVTDPYSNALYSTENTDYNFLLEEERQGLSKHEAVLKLSKKYGELPADNEIGL